MDRSRPHAHEMLPVAPSNGDETDDITAWSDGEPPPDSPDGGGSNGEDEEHSGTSSNSQSSGDIYRSCYNDELCLTLRSHIERLSAWEEIVESLAGTDFVFTVETPSAAETSCVLDTNTHNSALSYQDFLSECASSIKDGAKSHRRRHRLLAKITQRLWQPASEAFEALKSAKFRHQAEVNVVEVGKLLDTPPPTQLPKLKF